MGMSFVSDEQKDNKKTKTKTAKKTNTMTKTLREHPERAIIVTFDLLDI